MIPSFEVTGWLSLHGFDVVAVQNAKNTKSCENAPSISLPFDLFLGDFSLRGDVAAIGDGQHERCGSAGTFALCIRIPAAYSALSYLFFLRVKCVALHRSLKEKAEDGIQMKCVQGGDFHLIFAMHCCSESVRRPQQQQKVMLYCQDLIYFSFTL